MIMEPLIGLDDKWYCNTLDSGRYTRVGYCTLDGGHVSRDTALGCYLRYRAEKVVVLVPWWVSDGWRQVRGLCAAEYCTSMTCGYAAEEGAVLMFLCEDHLSRTFVRQALIELEVEA